MGVRIRYEFTSDFDGVQWQCDIHDNDYAAAINTASGNGFQITYNGNGDAPLANIKGSSCRLNLIWREDDAFYTGFINDLKGANEHEFALVIYKDSSLYWVGNITGDSLSWGNENTGRELTIDAIDGLGRLRDMRYKAVTTARRNASLNNKKVFEILLDLLSLNNLDQFWGASDPYIEFEPHWILNTSYTDWLDRLSIPKHIFYDNMEYNEKTPRQRYDLYEGKSAYECLEIILTHLNMRLIHSDGRYWLQQVMGMTGANAATRYTYYKTSTPISTSPYKWWQSSATTVARNAAVGTDVEVLSGGKFSYFQGLQRSEVEIPDQLFVLKDIQQSYTDTVLNPTNCPFSESETIEGVTGGTGTNKRIKVFINLSTLSVGLLSQYSNRYFVRLKFKIEAGSYRLYDNGQNKFTNLTWTTTATDTVTYDLPRTAYLYHTGNIVLETPEIPWTNEDVTITITYDVIDSNTGSSYTNNNLTYSVDYVGMSVVDQDGEVGITKIVCENPDITDYQNNTLYKHPDYLLNDFTDLASYYSFQLNTTGTTNVYVTTVDSGHLNDGYISQTIAQDAMALQMYAIQVYEGAITGSYEPYKTFEYDSNYYVFNGGTFDAKNDEWNCQWWQSSPEIGTVDNPDRSDGRHIEYDGDDWVKKYQRVPVPWDHYGDVKDVFYGETIGGSGGSYGDALTTLTINSATESLFKNGDELLILNPDTLELLEEVTLTADVDATDTSMSFSSVTLGNNIPPDAIILRKGSDGFCSPSIRTNELEVTDLVLTPAQVTPTSSDFVLILDDSDSDKIKKVPYPVSEFANYKYYSTSYSVSIATAGTPVDLNLGTPTDSNIGTNFSYNTSTGVLTYSGSRGAIRVSVSAEIYPDGTGSKHIGLYIRHSSDGDVILPVRQYVTAGSETDKKLFSFSGAFEMQAGETITIRAANYTDTEDLNIQYLQLFASSI